jgi:hypothetical protein
LTEEEGEDSLAAGCEKKHSTVCDRDRVLRQRDTSATLWRDTFSVSLLVSSILLAAANGGVFPYAWLLACYSATFLSLGDRALRRRVSFVPQLGRHFVR